MKAFQVPAPHITRADVPLTTLQSDLRRLLARQRMDAAVERLRWLLAHPEDAPHKPATAGEIAEQRHLLYDADPDSTVRPFVYCWKGVKP